MTKKEDYALQAKPGHKLTNKTKQPLHGTPGPKIVDKKIQTRGKKQIQKLQNAKNRKVHIPGRTGPTIDEKKNKTTFKTKRSKN